ARAGDRVLCVAHLSEVEAGAAGGEAELVEDVRARRRAGKLAVEEEGEVLRAHARLEGREERAARRGKITPVVREVVACGELLRALAAVEDVVELGRKDRAARARRECLREGVVAVDAERVVGEGVE